MQQEIEELGFDRLVLKMSMNEGLLIWNRKALGIQRFELKLRVFADLASNFKIKFLSFNHIGINYEF